MQSIPLRNMLERHGYPVLDTAGVADFLAEHPEVVLFFAGDPVQFPETNDVAMILPELVRAFAGRFSAALVDGSAERELQARYGFKTWPALVFLRAGEYLGAITQVQNWDDYLREIDRLLAATPTRPPGFRVPVVAESSHGCGH